MKRASGPNGFTIIEGIIIVLVFGLLLFLAIPAAWRVRTQGAQMKDLNNGKQIYYGLKLFATDNDGRFPWANFDSATGAPASGRKVTSANAAFQNICPQYIQSRATFYVEQSAWTPHVPDTASPLNQAGQNAYAYVPGLTIESNPAFPLLADGFSTTVGVYSREPGQKGGLWKGAKALVVRVDGASRFEPCDSRTLNIRGEDGRPDLFAPAAGWIPKAPVNPL